MENGENMLSHDKRSQLLLCQTVKDSSPSTDQATCLRGHAMRKKNKKSTKVRLTAAFNSILFLEAWNGNGIT